MAILNNSNAISSGGYDINNSLRFRSSASAYLSRTPASSGNRQVWTWSAWIKRGTLGGASNVLFNCYNTASSTQTSIEFANDTLGVFSNDSSTVNLNLFTTQVFRDPSAWYHFVVTVDTTQATSSNRVKIYVNGSQITAFSTSTYPSLNYNSHINTTSLHTTFATRTPSGLTDGYLAENNFIDGSAKTPSDFGETDTTTGVWKPKAYTGTYGTNGFYLKFSDIATTSGSNAGLGKDFSGNANYWTTNNISVTSGTTYDAMIDSPTLTSATVANYCVWNPLRTSSAIVTNANLTVSQNTTAYVASTGTFGVSSGKWYWEAYVVNQTSVLGMGITAVYNVNGLTTGIVTYQQDGTKYLGSVNSSYGSSFTTNDIIGFALDMDAGTLTCYKNNVSQGVIETGLSGTWYPYVTMYSTNSISSTFGQRPFSYTPPTGFNRLNTYNLPDSTIKKGNTVMDATTYTGDGTTRSITNASSFKPDLVWVKSRSNAEWNILFDSVRGTGKSIYSNDTSAEVTNAGNGYVSAFNSNGYSVTPGGSGSANVNASAYTYVAWQWQAGQGSTSSNTSGSITSTVSVNATAGFSVCTFNAGASGNQSFGHGLGVAPKMVIIKDRANAVGWNVYHSSVVTATNQFLQLNSTNAISTATGVWGSALPTSTLVGIGSGTVITANANGVAYCWADVSGYSKAFSYTGNGSSDGPMVYLGFRPKWILIKNASNGVQGWTIQDTSRSTYNVVDNYLLAQASSAEQTIYAQMDYLSNGFKVRTSDALVNGSGNTIIGMAFAEHPFKNSNAR